MTDETVTIVEVHPGLVHEVDLAVHALLNRYAGRLRASDLIVHVIACACAQVMGRGHDEGLSIDDALEDVEAFINAGREAGIRIALQSPSCEGWK